MISSSVLRVEQAGETVIITPLVNLGEMIFDTHKAEIIDTLRPLETDEAVRNVVLDFEEADYFGSSAVGIFVRLWRRLNARGGQLVVCNASEHELDILNTTNLDDVWPVCDDRQAALRLLEESRTAP